MPHPAFCSARSARRLALAALAPFLVVSGPRALSAQTPPVGPRPGPAAGPRPTGAAPAGGARPDPQPVGSVARPDATPAPGLDAIPFDVPDAPRPPPPGAVPPSVGAPLEPLTFDASVQRAVNRNPTALEAQQVVARFHALMEQVRAASLPTLNGIGTYTRLDRDRVANGVIVQNAGSLNMNVTANIPLVYPRGWVQWEQASDRVDVARANSLDVRRIVAVATGRA